MDGADVGESKVDVSNAATLLALLEIQASLDRVEAILAPLVPHIPAVVAMLDNPAARWRMRRNGRTGD